MLSKKKILLLGGAGFIGSNLARKLVQGGYEITIFDNFSSGDIKNLRGIREKVKIVNGDILDFKKIHKTISNFLPNIIFHFAAFHYIPECSKCPQKTLNINVRGTENLLKSIIFFNITPYFIFVSSASVYCNSSQKLCEESSIKPIDIYGYSKFLGEKIIKEYGKKYKIPYTIIRLFNVYGYKDRIPHLIPEIIDQIKKKNRVIKLGDSKPKRDFIFIEDVVDALICLVKKQPKNIILNLGTGREYSVKEIIRNIEVLLGYKLEIRQNKNLFRKVERLHLCANNRKIKKILNWKPCISIREGLNILLKKEGIL